MTLALSRLFKRKETNYPTVKLDESKVPDEVGKLEKHLYSKIIGQDRAIKQFVRAYEAFLTDMQRPDGPVGVLLFLGPTGVGKTRIMEVFAEYLWGTSEALIKIDCAEFQQSHEISKLIGSPPGYVGHKDTNPIFSKEAIERHWKNGPKFTPVLFDEIEKGHPALHRILLGINGSGRMRTGSNEVVDMRSTLIVMTSNLGSRSVSSMLSGKRYGFTSSTTIGQMDQDIYKACKDAVKNFFDSEFFNRIDRMVAFRPLTDEDFRKILDIELGFIQDRVIRGNKFIIIDNSRQAKEFLLKEGVSQEFGARELRRTIERHLVSKLTRAFSTKQAIDGDMILSDCENGRDLDISIMKGVLDILAAKPVLADESWIKKDALIPFESIIKPGRCGRCGLMWHLTHTCFDIMSKNKEKK